MIGRFFFELRHPAVKCARVGHKPGVETRRGYRRPVSSDGFRYICMRVRQERPACRRCKEPLGEWRETNCQGFTGYSWPSEQAEAFHRDGEYWIAHGYSAAGEA